MGWSMEACSRVKARTWGPGRRDAPVTAEAPRNPNWGSRPTSILSIYNGQKSVLGR